MNESPARVRMAADGRAALWATLVSWAVLAAAAAALGLERGCYWQCLASNVAGLTAWDRSLLIWMLASKTLFLLSLVLAPAAVALLAGRRRVAWWIALLSAWLFVWWLVVDLKTFAITGNHVLKYLGFAQAGAGENAGGYAWMFRVAARTLALTLVVVAGSLWLWQEAMSRTIASFRRAGGIVPSVGLHVIYLVALLGWVAMQGWFSRPAALRAVCAAMPVDLSFLVRPDPAAREFARRFDQRVGPVLERRGRALRQPRPADETTRLAGAALPNIVLIVCESFRTDAIDPKTMPGVDAWSRGGLRCTRHYSGSNSTAPGLFELLYGRSCMTLNATLDAQVAPQLCATLRLSGYRLTFISCVSMSWERIDEFVNQRTFERVEVEATSDWVAGDRRSMARAREILRESPDQPQFVMVFLQCTHLPYFYPAEFETFKPAAAAGAVVLDLTAEDEVPMKNRYRNSAAYLDSLIAQFVQGVDPKRNIIAVTGDHGESFFDDGTGFHASRLSDIQTRTPLLIVGPHVPAGVEGRFTVHADFLPTVLHAAAGSPVRPAGVTGIDLLAPTESSPRECVLLARTYSDPFALALVGPAGRIELRLSLKDGQAKVVGRLGPDGLTDTETPLAPADAAPWAEALCWQLQRMAE